MDDDAAVLLRHGRHRRRVVGERKMVLGVQKRIHEMKQRFPFAATIVNVVIVVVVVMMMMMVAFVISPRVYRVRVLLLEIWGRWKAMTRLWVLVVVFFFW